MTREIQVGLLFFVALAILFVATVLLQDIDLFAEHYEVSVTFDEVAGLQQGDDVQYLGIPEVGKVRSILPNDIGGVEVILKLKKSVHIPRNALVTIESTTVLGGMHVEIRPDPSEIAPPIPTDRDTPYRIAGARVRDMMEHIHEAAGVFMEAGRTINRMLDRIEHGEGTFWAVFEDERMAGDLRNAVADAARFMNKINSDEGPLGAMVNSREMENDIRASVAAVRRTIERIDRGEGVLGVLMSDVESASDVRSFLRNLEEISEKANTGRGVIGRLVDHEGMGNDLEAILAHVRSITEKIDEGEGLAAEAINPGTELHRGVQEAIENVNRAFDLRTFLTLESRVIPEKDYSISRLGIRIEPRTDKFYDAGVVLFDIDRTSPLVTPRRLDRFARGKDDPEITFDAMIGRRFYDRQLALRAGFLEGQPGAGVEWTPHWLHWEEGLLERVSMKVEGRNSWNDRDIEEHFDPFLLRAEVNVDLRIHKDWPSLRLFLGGENLWDDATGMAGIGIFFEDRDLKYLVGLLGSGT